MKLENEIKQKKFRNEFHKLAVNIIYTHSWLQYSYKNLFNKFNITSNQFNILRILRGQYPKPCSINLLRERMLDKMSDASRLVDRLVAKGLVNRTICKEDRRKANVLITEKGLKLLSEIDKLENEFDKIFNNITKKEAIFLNNLLDKLRG
ncbi:MAG: MarR family winged helix-turn-helix transcriptional regulator [Melioribacter sp.]|nr:MarR family winged helix-turn-helix transcriptional regulator [Melioribacter sp.]